MTRHKEENAIGSGNGQIKTIKQTAKLPNICSRIYQRLMLITTFFLVQMVTWLIITPLIDGSNPFDPSFSNIFSQLHLNEQKTENDPFATRFELLTSSDGSDQSTY